MNIVNEEAEALRLLRDWLSQETDITWSIGGPGKGVRGTKKYRVTLYRYRTPRWENRVCKHSESLLEAVQDALMEWKEKEG